MSEAPYPPAEPPADGDRTSQVPPPHGMAPRYSASASVPVPPAQPANQPPGGGAYGVPANPYGQGSQYGQQGGQYGQDGPLGQSPAGQSPTSGQARSAASSSVPAPATQPNPPPYGSPPPSYQAQSGGTYGAPSPSGQPYGSPTGAQPSGQGQFGSSPMGQFGQPPAGQGSFGKDPGYGQQPGGGPQSPSGPPAGAPNYGGGYDRQPAPAPMGQQMGQGQYGAPTYGQPPDQGRPGGGQATGGWSEPGLEPQPPARKSRRGLIVTVIVVAVLIVVGVGGFVGWSLTNKGSDFTVGACVKQDGTDAVLTDCGGGAGVYKIASIVDAEDGCPDANQPSLVLTERVGGGKKWACLEPSS